MHRLRWFLWLWVAVLATPTLAQAVADPALTARANDLPRIMAGGIAYDDYFAPIFTREIPEPRFRQIAGQLATANGPVTLVESITPTGPFNATVRLGYQRAIATVVIAVDPSAPHKVTGLRITDAEPRGDSLAKLRSDIAKLRGRHAVIVTELGRAPLLAVNADTPGAIGSVFKLFVLAELARAAEAGERRWTDIVPLAPDLVSSPSTAHWPAGTPMTLQAAATAMIATSDNRATDTVMAALDSARLEATARSLGIDERSLPLLDTRTALAMKVEPGSALARRWADADTAARRRLLAGSGSAIQAASASVTEAAFNGAPRHIDTVEWFASPAAITRVLARLREAGPEVAGILAVNRGVAPADRFGWVGYKGGSEPGVIAMSYLVRTRTGRWYAVSGHWNDPARPVEDMTFTTLMRRALALVPQD